MAGYLLSFDDERARRGAYARSDVGMQMVDVARVTGSVGRAGVFDRRFRYRRGQAPLEAEARLRRLRTLFDRGAVPPLELYRIGDDLFVVDGHHRLAIAREYGQTQIEAHVVEYTPDRSDPRDALYLERRVFIRATGLDSVHATEPGRYPRLLSRIRDHRHELSRSPTPATAFTLVTGAQAGENAPDLRTAARDWYGREYRPVLDLLAARRIGQRFPGRAAGDLYGYVCDHRWYLSERRGWDVGLDEALHDFVHRHVPETTPESRLDPLAALGEELLGSLAGDAGLVAGTVSVGRRWATLAAGLLALPLALARGWRPNDTRVPRPLA